MKVKIRPTVLIAFFVLGFLAWQALPGNEEVALACVVGMVAALGKLVEKD